MDNNDIIHTTNNDFIDNIDDYEMFNFQPDLIEPQYKKTIIKNIHFLSQNAITEITRHFEQAIQKIIKDLDYKEPLNRPEMAFNDLKNFFEYEIEQLTDNINDYIL